ncbi:MAG: YceH family protein [Planctomycetes bacterium]|nr:YceH family protein [Planctomycetota bacterium]
MSEATTAWPVLNFLERRILGVLVEKAKTTPDVYPMTMNSLVAGCNQKSNRDPLMNVDDTQLEEALEGLKEKGLVVQVTGTRVDRWRQLLYEVLLVGKVELAVITELLLRGPQTEGELRGRASRMEPIEDIEELRNLLKPLAERKLVVYLTRERSRGTVVTHGFHDPQELERLRTIHSTGVGAEEIVHTPVARLAVAPAAPPAPDRLERLEEEVRQLRSELTSVTATVAELRQALGVPPA